MLIIKTLEQLIPENYSGEKVTRMDLEYPRDMRVMTCDGCGVETGLHCRDTGEFMKCARLSAEASA